MMFKDGVYQISVFLGHGEVETAVVYVEFVTIESVALEARFSYDSFTDDDLRIRVYVRQYVAHFLKDYHPQPSQCVHHFHDAEPCRHCRMPQSDFAGQIAAIRKEIYDRIGGAHLPFSPVGSRIRHAEMV